MPGLTFDHSTRTLSGTAAVADTYRMTYTVADGDTNTNDSDADTQRFVIIVALKPDEISNKIPEPATPPADVREFLELDPYYQQWISIEGFPVIAAPDVNPYALKEAAWVIAKMIGHRWDVLRTMKDNKGRFAVIAHDEVISELPEYKIHEKWPDFLAYPFRGFGGTQGATISAGEEGILKFPGAHRSYSVLLHEFAHGVHVLGLRTLDTTFDRRLETAYRTAMERGLWQGTYAASDPREYWAEGTHAWFFPNGGASFRNFGSSRQELRQYDRALAALLVEVYGDSEWTYTLPATRTHLAHLRGFDPEDLPTFEGFPELAALADQFYNDLSSDGGGRWENLQRHDLSALRRLLDKPRGPRDTAIAFLNLTDRTLNLYEAWLDGRGQIRQNYWSRVAAHGVRSRPTRINEVWVVKDLDGATVAVFQVGVKTGRAVIPQ